MYMGVWCIIEVFYQWVKNLFFSRVNPQNHVTFRKNSKIRFVFGANTTTILSRSPRIPFYHCCTFFFSACVLLLPMPRVCAFLGWPVLDLLKLPCLFCFLPLPLPNSYFCLLSFEEKKKNNEKVFYLKFSLMGGFFFTTVFQDV